MQKRVKNQNQAFLKQELHNDRCIDCKSCLDCMTAKDEQLILGVLGVKGIIKKNLIKKI